MKVRSKFLLTCATGALVIAAGSLTARAADQGMPLKAEPAAVADGWWYHYYVEVGGRGFLNDPKRDGIKGAGTGDSLAKFYEYRDLRPGPFADGWFAIGTNNGLWLIDGWGKNVGYDDQAYQLNVSKAGEHYFTFGWDETPHLYSTSALTLFNGVGTNALTLPGGLSASLFGPAGAGCTAVPNAQPAGCGSPLSAAAAARVQSLINSNVHQTDIGIRRDTAAVEYRWTPTDNWDVRVAYSNMHRTGTQVDGIVFSPGTSGVKVEALKPVDDTTQNYAASGEYIGTSFWNQRYTFKVGYAGSTYTDRWNSYTVENPFCPAGGATNTTTQGFCARNGSPSTPVALVSLPPDNQANGVTGTLGADLPWNSRYMGTVSYTMMRQNDAFLPFTLSPTVFTNSGNTTVGPAPLNPYSSLNGAINTLLSNNVLVTQITPELKNKATYRFYDFDNNTPRLTFADWVLTDVKLASVTAANNGYAPNSSLPVAYTKQNAGDELVWRPNHNWNLGAAYGFERYDWKFESADRTDEHSGRVFADWKPFSDVVARASYLFAQRRYDNYDYINNMAVIQWPGSPATGSCNTGTGCSTRSVSAMRQFYLNNRDRNKAQAQLTWQATPAFSITPSAGLLFDDYSIDPATQVGITRSHSWRAGVEADYVFSPQTTFLLSYMFEHFNQNMISSTATGTGNAFAPGSLYFTNITDSVHTVMAAVNYAAIPDRLDLRFSYTISLTTDTQPVVFANGTIPSTGQYPTVNNVWQRFDATAKYRFDPDWVHSIGWKGDIFAKLMYAWERNSMGNWQIDIMNAYMFNVTANSGYMTWMAFDNPNYNVHLLAGSIGFAW
jgi:MtrB/PioB family decaheme-associated outer membrane protein